MKEKELREHSTCNLCNKKIGEGHIPMFWRIKIERFGLHLKALSRQQGLAMSMGGHAGLAMIMGPDEEMTMPIMDPVILTVCEDCACKPDAHCVASMAEMEKTNG